MNTVQVKASTPSNVSDTPASATSLDPHADETGAHRDARMAWWRQARFGMFIHWGLYAVPAGVWHGKETAGNFSCGAGEWIMYDMKIPVTDYAAQAKAFNPTKFDADTWVNIAKAAGMKYIVMTAKHHEGFAMYPTKVDGFNIYDATPFKRDPIGEMAAACKKAGIKFGVYYSQNLDWHHPGGNTLGPAWDPAQTGSFDQYVNKVAAPQLSELIDRYRPAILWFDIPGDLTPEETKALTASFSKDPELIFNNRMGGGVPGDTETPEQHVPATGYPGKDWETCMTINDTWGYKSSDTDFKSAPELLRNLIDIASKGGNYLLNVGPDATGTIPAPEVERLTAIGQWLQRNGQSIYGTTASPFQRLPFDGRATVKGDTLYLNVFAWPESGLKLVGLQTPVRSAKVLATGERLAVTRDTDGTLIVSRPSVMDPVSTAIAIALSGTPSVDLTAMPTVVSPRSDGSYRLRAADAEIQGATAQLEGSLGSQDIGYWTNINDMVQWTLAVPTSAERRYSVHLDYACASGSAGSVALLIDGKPTDVTATPASTGGWGDYQTIRLPGLVTLPGGRHRLTIKPLHATNAVMNLRSITLVPAAH